MMRIVKLLVAAGLWLHCGCSATTGRPLWGEEAFRWETMRRVPERALDALVDPVTLGAAAGALVFAIDDFDEETAEWAADENPIFGSRNSAADASDTLRSILLFEAIGTALITPSGSSTGEWLANKAKGAIVEGLALQASSASIDLLKDQVTRTRPDRSTRSSFPSGHAGAGSAGAALANRNLEYLDINHSLRTGLQAGNIALALGTGWARVEAKKHFPSDILAGFAISRVVTLLIHDTLLGPAEDPLVLFELSTDDPPTVMLQFVRNF